MERVIERKAKARGGGGAGDEASLNSFSSIILPCNLDVGLAQTPEVLNILKRKIQSVDFFKDKENK